MADFSNPLLDVAEEVERKSRNNVKRIDNILGATFVPMIHPKTGKLVQLPAEPTQVIRYLVKGFVMIMNSETGLMCKLQIDYGLEPDLLVKLREEEEESERRGVYGEGEDAELQLSRTDGEEGEASDDSGTRGKRRSKVRSSDSGDGKGRKPSRGAKGKGTRGRKQKG